MTIAASMGGTAAATCISTSVPFVDCKWMEVFNLTGRNLELILGPDIGTTQYTIQTGSTASVVSPGTLFCPGTAALTAGGRNNGNEIIITQGMQLYIRTTENTAATCSATGPFVINFWA